MPPIDGLHDIWPRVSMLCVSSSVRRPMRAAASAASVPAWPPPTTMTSKSSGNFMGVANFTRALLARARDPCVSRGTALMLHSSTLVFAFAAAAGASFPPITVCMRSYLRQRLRDDALLTAAYSLDSVLIETMFIFGPLLVALFVAFASPSMAVAFAGASGLVGV